jgi:hypothetical protein
MDEVCTEAARSQGLCVGSGADGASFDTALRACSG